MDRDDAEFVVPPPYNLHVHVHLEPDPRIDKILTAINQLSTKEDTTMADLNALTAEVRANGDVVASAVTLLQGLSAALTAAGTDPVALQELVDQLNTNDNQLAQAVVANTPAATVPPPAEVPTEPAPTDTGTPAV